MEERERDSSTVRIPGKPERSRSRNPMGKDMNYVEDIRVLVVGRTIIVGTVDGAVLSSECATVEGCRTYVGNFYIESGAGSASGALAVFLVNCRNSWPHVVAKYAVLAGHVLNNIKDVVIVHVVSKVRGGGISAGMNADKLVELGLRWALALRLAGQVVLSGIEIDILEGRIGLQHEVALKDRADDLAFGILLVLRIAYNKSLADIVSTTADARIGGLTLAPVEGFLYIAAYTRHKRSGFEG